jgi:hypothetical protein
MKRRMRSHLTIPVALLVLATASCSKSDKPETSSPTPQPSVSASQASAAKEDAAGDGAFVCALLTKEETEAVQGEPFKATKPSQKSSMGLTVAQCYFELPTTVNSIVVTVTQKAAGPDGRDPKQSWQEIFHKESSSEKKEEEGAKPEKIEGVGDEAFWTGTRVGGALYVLKGNSYLRISIGGGADRTQKIEKSKALAQSVLKRL